MHACRKDTDNRGRRTVQIDRGGASHFTVYESGRRLSFPYWDGTANEPILPIQALESDDAGRTLESYTVKPSRTAATGGAPTGLSAGTDQSHYLSWTTNIYDDLDGSLTETRRYHDIPSSGVGTLVTDYYSTIQQYDDLGRHEYTIQVSTGNSLLDDWVEQVTRNIHDTLGRVIEVRRGVSSLTHDMGSSYSTYPTLETVSETFFDDDGVGDGHVTATRKYFGTGANDFTGENFHRTYRGHLRGTEPFYGDSGSETAIGPFTVHDLDWTGKTVADAVYDTNPTWSSVLTGDNYTDYTTTTTNRRTLRKSYFDDLGRNYETRTYTVSESTGAAGSYFVSWNYYDRNSRVVCSEERYGAAVERAYDGAGRLYQTRVVEEPETTKYSSGVFQYRAPTPEPDLGDMTGGDDVVYTIEHKTFDDAGNVTEIHSFEQNHDDSTDGIDFTNDDDYVRETTYRWYDSADRLSAEARYGSGDTATGDGEWKYAAIPTRPSTAPSTDEKKLVTTYTYPDYTVDGNPVSVESPDGVETRTYFDAMGRSVYVSSNHVNFTFSETGTGGTDTSEDTVVKYAYDGLGVMFNQIALDPNGDGTTTDQQKTQHECKDDHDASRITRTIHPDSTDEDFQYALDGALTKRTDDNGTVIDYEYNDRRQIELEKVTTLGTNVDGHVRSVKREYDDMARLEKVTCYANSDGTGTVRNQIVYEYDDLGNVTKSYQSREGAKDGSTPYVEYAYDSSAVFSVFSDGMRLESVTYPAGRVVNYDYGTSQGISDRLHRAEKIKDDAGTPNTLVRYDYSGLGRLAIADYEQADVKLDYFQGTSGTYTGLDRFGRVKDQYWNDYGASQVADRVKYGHDYEGNRVYREQVGETGWDWFYVYDDLSRLVQAHQGDLDGNNEITSANASFRQHWTLDQVQNWKKFKEDANGDNDFSDSGDLDQNRTHNDENMITNITEGGSQLPWATPSYNADGSTKSSSRPGTENLLDTYTYDAWRRIVKVKHFLSTKGEYEYDGLGRRISAKDNSAGQTRYFYYNEAWQVLEVRDSADDTNPVEEYVWHPYYIDALALRFYDPDHDGTGDTYYYCHDANMNVTATMNDTGDVQERYAYLPYGEVSILDADFSADADGVSDNGNNVTFTGRRLDPETGLMHYRHRAYSTSLGRFLQLDPIGIWGDRANGGNGYGYVGGRPVNFVDPLGKLGFIGLALEAIFSAIKLKKANSIAELIDDPSLHLDTLCKLCCHDYHSSNGRNSGVTSQKLTFRGETMTVTCNNALTAGNNCLAVVFMDLPDGSSMWAKCDCCQNNSKWPVSVGGWKEWVRWKGDEEIERRKRSGWPHYSSRLSRAEDVLLSWDGDGNSYGDGGLQVSRGKPGAGRLSTSGFQQTNDPDTR